MVDQRYAPRERKAEKIAAILHDCLGPDLSHKVCLDVGCGSGLISDYLSNAFGSVVGIEIDYRVLCQANTVRQGKALFAVASGEGMPLPDASVEVVVCAQVYEHTAHLPLLASEIWRVLQPGGVCFFSGPNKFAFMEEHYWLPFLSWLPGPIADLYMRLSRRGSRYDIGPKSYWQLRQTWRQFAVHDYASRLIRTPERFGFGEVNVFLKLLRVLPGFCLDGLKPLLPNFNWILVKPM
jgi:ubiquinone/menaquinone biosynthesis C-methylase UbiE